MPCLPCVFSASYHVRILPEHLLKEIIYIVEEVCFPLYCHDVNVARIPDAAPVVPAPAIAAMRHHSVPLRRRSPNAH